MSAYSVVTPVDAELPLAPVLPRAGQFQGLRIAIVHEWFTSYAGSERVVEQILNLFPQADVFSLVNHLPAGETGFLRGKAVKTSFLQRLPARHFRKLLWLMPSAIETFDLSGYNIIISSSHAVAKGVLTGPDQVHVCYCHSPIRYAWDLQHEYLRQSGLEKGLGSIYARLVLHYLRLWDVRTANGVDRFIANSQFVARRINKVYNRTASVVHPPVDVESFQMRSQKEDFYLTASRLVPYKRVDLIVAAFAKMPDRKLVVVGEGPGLAQCKSLARNNIQFIGYQDAAKLQHLMATAKAFVFAAEEDFGITLVEAQACGTPVIAYGRGGALDSILPDKTGVFFDAQTPESIVASVDRFESGVAGFYDAAGIRKHAERFGIDQFQAKLGQIVAEEWNHLNQG
jgi:glycosyltransferase involved in cell wall biosynthesis